MSGRPTREAVLQGLFTALQAAVTVQFTANTTAGNGVLGSPSSTQGLMVGQAIAGGSLPENTVITAISPLTVAPAPLANGAGVQFTAGVLKSGRRVIPASQARSQPAMFLRSVEERLEYVNTVLQEQRISAQVWFYANLGQNPDAVPEIALNNLLDQLQAAMAPDDPSSARYTIGGLVYWCRMNGRVIKDGGDAAGQAMAMAEIEIIVP